jgi:hypothetical protein
MGCKSFSLMDASRQGLKPATVGGRYTSEGTGLEQEGAGRHGERFCQEVADGRYKNGSKDPPLRGAGL